MKAFCARHILWISIAFGALAGAAVAIGDSNTGIWSAGVLIGYISGFFVFPVFVTILASRRYFYWGIVPGVAFLPFSVIFCVATFAHLLLIRGGFIPFINVLNEHARVVPYIMPPAFFITVLSASLASLIRYIIQRRWMPAHVASEAVTEKHEGAWPPPPAQDSPAENKK